MPTNTIVLNQNPTSNSSYNHISDYIPKISEWSYGKSCQFIDSPTKTEKKNCCSSIKALDRAIDKAYSNGLQSHLGISAIVGHPCVTESEIGKLSNDLDKKIRQYGIKMALPEGLDPNKRSATSTTEVRDYCKEVIFEKLARELGRVSDSKPIAFTKQVLKYCLSITYP